MPASDLHDPEATTATGRKIVELFCPDCDEYSGGGVCRVCERGAGPVFDPPVPEHHKDAATPPTLPGF